MSQFPVDVDAEAIFVDGTWYTREDLSRRIRAMLDAGDFNVARPSMALQDLTQMMQGVRTLAFRAPPELAEALTAVATRLQQSVGAVIREAVTQYITDANSGPHAVPAPAEEPTLRAPIPLDTTASSEALPKVIVEPQVAAAPIAGPGALKAAGVEPIEMQRKPAAPQTDAERERTEQGWFKQ